MKPDIGRKSNQGTLNQNQQKTETWESMEIKEEQYKQVKPAEEAVPRIYGLP